jgi:hypothetical protein
VVGEAMAVAVAEVLEDDLTNLAQVGGAWRRSVGCG